MDPVGDRPLDRELVEIDRPTTDRRGRVAAGVLAAIAIAAAAWYFWPERVRPAAPTTGAVLSETRASPSAAARAPLGPEVQQGPLPPLDETDPMVRQLLGALSSHPQVAAWLATDGLVRQFVAAVDNVATGTTPARHMKVLAPPDPFEARPQGGRTVISERSFARYDALAEAVAEIDPSALAVLYARLRPRLQEAYVELGNPAGHVDAAVGQAIVHLLETPVPELPVEVEPGVLSFKFREERLERLSAAQKQLVRMGPRNMRRVQSQLWAVGRELGIPTDRLGPVPE